MDPTIIERELVHRYKLQPITVFPMKWKEEGQKAFRDRLYLIHFREGTEKKAVRTIRSSIVRWDPHRGSKDNMTQCGAAGGCGCIQVCYL